MKIIIYSLILALIQTALIMLLLKSMGYLEKKSEIAYETTWNLEKLKEIYKREKVRGMIGHKSLNDNYSGFNNVSIGKHPGEQCMGWSVKQNRWMGKNCPKEPPQWAKDGLKEPPQMDWVEGE